MTPMSVFRRSRELRMKVIHGLRKLRRPFMTLMSAVRNLRKIFMRVHCGVRNLRQVFLSPSRPISRRLSPSVSPPPRFSALRRLS